MKKSLDALLGLNLAGKRALITGASAGIGEATAIWLADLGVEVFAVARRREKLESLQAAHPLIRPVICDIRSSTLAIERVVAENEIDILINNAGLAKGRAGIAQVSEDDWNLMIETNLLALLKVTKIILPQMIKRDRGDIVNLGSIAGLQTYPGGSVYCATKYAVHALSQAWRQDLLGTNIRVIEICPGMVETEFSLVRLNGDEALAKRVYEGMRPLVADDIASSIVWALAQPEHVTLQNMVVMPTDQAGVGQIYRERR